MIAGRPDGAGVPPSERRQRGRNPSLMIRQSVVWKGEVGMVQTIQIGRFHELEVIELVQGGVLLGAAGREPGD